MFPLDTLLTMFISFTIEIIVAGVMLIKHPLTFRFKPYISIPVGLLIACSGGAFSVVFVYSILKHWNEVLNVVVYTIPILTIFCGFLFAYKISPLNLMLLLSVAYTFQHMAYQSGVIVLDTGLSTQIFYGVGGDINLYNFFYNLILYTIKAGVYVACYFTIARTYVKYSK